MTMASVVSESGLRACATQTLLRYIVCTVKIHLQCANTWTIVGSKTRLMQLVQPPSATVCTISIAELHTQTQLDVGTRTAVHPLSQNSALAACIASHVAPARQRQIPIR